MRFLFGEDRARWARLQRRPFQKRYEDGSSYPLIKGGPGVEFANHKGVAAGRQLGSEGPQRALSYACGFPQVLVVGTVDLADLADENGATEIGLAVARTSLPSSTVSDSFSKVEI